MDPENTGASLQLAMMQRQKGNDQEAVELLESIAEGNPESAQIWNALGRMKYAGKDYAGAEQAFARAIELKTTDRATPLRLIDVLIKQGKLEQAREMLQNLPRRGPMKSTVHRFYGDIYAAKKLYEEAVESYRASILHSPDGERLMAEIEAAAGPGASNEALIPHFEAAFAKLREERRQAAQSEPSSRRMAGAVPGAGARRMALERSARAH
jgi:tetratricopeptide (TPR) repeat protein